METISHSLDSGGWLCDFVGNMGRELRAMASINQQRLPPEMQLKYLLAVGILILLFLTYLDFKSVGLL